MMRLRVIIFFASALLGALFSERAFGQSLPDLIISSGPSGLSEVTNDQRDTISVTVRNIGADTVRTAIDVAVFLSADTAPQLDERVGVDLIVEALAPGDSALATVPVRVPALLALGAYVWLAQVDALGGIAETDESNNVRTGNAVDVVAPPADLAIASAPVGPAEVNLNGSYAVALTVENRGDGATQAGFDVAVFLSRDAAWDSTDALVGQYSAVNTLSPGIPLPVQVTAAIPDSLALGDYFWLVRVDAEDAIAEPDESDNVGLGNAVVVVNKLADLIISSPPVGPNGVYRRGNYLVTTEIKNEGTGRNTRVFDVVIYLSEDLVVGNSDDVRVGDIAIRDVLDVGASRTVDVPVAISALQALRAYHWVAVVDAVGFVAELNEGNNALIGQAVSVVPSPPDLVAENIQIPTQVQRNGVYAVDMAVRNAGDGATTGAFQVAVFLSADDLIGNADDVRIGTGTVTAVLGVGAGTALSVPVTVPSLQAFGAYRLAIVVDVGGVETEVNEQNNAQMTDAVVNVVPSPPDLLFVTDPVGDARIFRGVSDTVTVQIRNQGAGAVAGAFDVHVFLSEDDRADADDVQVGALEIHAPIASGEVLLLSVPVVVPVDQRLGTYRWWAQVDAADALDESDEANNVRVGVAVSVVHFPADLEIYEDLNAPQQVARGGVYSVGVAVRNAGQGPAESGFQVEVFLSADQLLDEDDVIAGTRKFPEALAAGGSRTVSISVAVPIEQPSNDYRWIARVSAVGLQDEARIDNNIRLGHIVSFPILTIEPDILDFALVRVGETKALTFEVRNGGTARLSFEIESPDPQVTVKPQSVTDLPPGVRWPIAVTFAPRGDGVLDAALRLNSNDPDGDGRVVLLGLAETPQADRIFLDLDPAEDNQQKTVLNTFSQQRVSVALFARDLPQILSAAIQIAYDARLLQFVEGSWAPEGLFHDVSETTVQHQDTGVLTIHVSDARSLSAGSGALGRIAFETRPEFRDSTGSGSRATVRVTQIQYLQIDGQVDSVQVLAEASAVYSMVCWADFDADGRIALGDFLLFKNAFEKRSTDLGWETEVSTLPAPQTPYRRYDGNGDGVVNLSDFVFLTQVFGQLCAP